MIDNDTQEKAEGTAKFNSMDDDDFRMWLVEKQDQMRADKECEFQTRTARWLTPYSRAPEAPPRQMSLVRRPHGAGKRQAHGQEGREQIHER